MIAVKLWSVLSARMAMLTLPPSHLRRLGQTAVNLQGEPAPPHSGITHSAPCSPVATADLPDSERVRLGLVIYGCEECHKIVAEFRTGISAFLQHGDRSTKRTDCLGSPPKAISAYVKYTERIGAVRIEAKRNQ